MATAFLPFAHLFEAFHGLMAWFAPRPAPVPRQATHQPRPAQRIAAPAAKPLRVLRVVEPCAPRAVAGRMVISGRMADVCAELDRLAAQEAMRA
ncbi:MAG: hypothetical protein EOO30_11990 [Comamonadaceae bacterium]|nr:MAG: hypothetical protein EOO30_11990 [Comamonadaceae bacterium]